MMKPEFKSATIENSGAAGDFPGSFTVVLSTGTKDRDGEEVRRDEWQEPLPDHITFDTDHGMSVDSTVGSGKPYFDADNRLLVDGTYSSLQKAQDVRTLVSEGHIRTVSVAFARHHSTTKDGTKTTSRELLNGAFVAIPANTEAVVLASKAGARNSSTDQQNIQDAHDALVATGAQCGPMDDSGAEDETTGGKSFRRMVAAKAVDGSYEQREQALSDALSSRYPGDDMWAYSIATFDDSVVYRVSGSSDLRGQWQAPYTYDEGVVVLGDAVRVNLVEQVVPMKSFHAKSVDDDKSDADALGADESADDAIDDAIDDADETKNFKGSTAASTVDVVALTYDAIRLMADLVE